MRSRLEERGYISLRVHGTTRRAEWDCGEREGEGEEEEEGEFNEGRTRRERRVRGKARKREEEEEEEEQEEKLTYLSTGCIKTRPSGGMVPFNNLLIWFRPSITFFRFSWC